MTMDQIAMVVGYVVLLVGGLAFAGALVGFAMDYLWRKLLRDVPSVYYVQNAVAEYKKKYPPGRWARDNEKV